VGRSLSAPPGRVRKDPLYVDSSELRSSGAIEEVDESALWLEILTESGICLGSTTALLWREADELTRILVRSRETARNNRQSTLTNKSTIKNRQSTTNQ